MGRNTGGVSAIQLEEGDEVVGLACTEPERTQVLAVCERGYGKRTELEEFRKINRGGKGVILIDCSDRNGPVVGIALVKSGDEVMLITDRGQTLRTPVGEIRETGRNAQGVKVMNVDEGERVVAIESVGESSRGPGSRRRRRRKRRRAARTASGESIAPGARRRRRAETARAEAQSRRRVADVRVVRKPGSRKRQAASSPTRRGTRFRAVAKGASRRALRARPPGSVPADRGHRAQRPEHRRRREPGDSRAVSRAGPTRARSAAPSSRRSKK